MLKIARIRIPEIAVAVAVSLFLAAGCAKIGEPQPPEVHVPKPATDLAVRQSSDIVVLTVAKPSRNTDGSEATTLERVDVFRIEEDSGPGSIGSAMPEEQFAKRAVRILSIPSAGFSKYLQGQSFIIEDKLEMPDRSLIYSRTYRYAVLFINRKNQTAGFSNQALIAPVAIPLPPAGLSAEARENHVGLKWLEPRENMDGSRPPRIAGYKIYRAEGSGEFGSTPIHPGLIQKSGFEDRHVEPDRIYRYAIRTVGSAADPIAESLPSEAVSVETRDVFPPAPPENFTAIREGGGIILLWAPSSSADVAGYKIYRVDKKTAARDLLRKDLITELNYRDSPPEPGGQYEYNIQAIDTHGNESIAVRAEVESR